MTKQPSFATDSATGRRSEPIEITPEMVEAGRRELVQIDYRFIDADEGAERVVRAALEAGGYGRRICPTL